MKNDEKFFKQLSAGEFTRVALPGAMLMVMATFAALPILDYIKWQIRGSGPFVLFSDSFSITFYCVFVTIMLFWEFRIYRNLYLKMQKAPFLTMEEEGMHIDKEMLPFPKEIGRPGKAELKWSNIQRIEAGHDKLIIFFLDKGKERSRKVDLKWIKKKKELLTALKIRCEKHNITWIEREKREK